PLSFCFVLIMRRPLPMSTCFPYTTLFRSLGGMVFLIVHSSLYQDAWKIVSVSIYGSALFLLYLVSTLYHTISPGKWKDRFQVLDHCAIYILIAASYTPYTLVTLNGGWGWYLFGASWGLCVI